MKKVLVLTGEGLNCERETAAAFARVGADVSFMPARTLIENPENLLQYHVLAFPGGFSFGDEIQSGHVLGYALAHSLKGTWHLFIQRGGLAIGICNGFQVLMKMGVFEAQSRTMALVANSPHGFQDRWVGLKVWPSRCVWTRGMDGQEMYVPMRHGEGRLWSEDSLKFNQLQKNQQVVFTYDEDVNGSMGQVAGICDPTGQVLGLMPHPEAALDEWLFAKKEKAEFKTIHLKIFENAMKESP